LRGKVASKIFRKTNINQCGFILVFFSPLNPANGDLEECKVNLLCNKKSKKRLSLKAPFGGLWAEFSHTP
jgi:hypothetical protein